MERFAQFVAVGGTGPVAVWFVRVSAVGTVPWTLGVVLAQSNARAAVRSNDRFSMHAPRRSRRLRAWQADLFELRRFDDRRAVSRVCRMVAARSRTYRGRVGSSQVIPAP